MRNAIVVLLAAAAAAHGQADIRACSLLKVEEVRQAIKTNTGEGGGIRSATGADGCLYSAGTGPSVMVVVDRSPGLRGSRYLIGKYKAALPDAKVHEIAGLGDQAVRIEHLALGAQVSVFRGSLNLTVTVAGMRNLGRAAGAAESLARKALARVK